jgi:mannose-6-phosphate isomerase-like protein (cupin superfamily)
LAEHRNVVVNKPWGFEYLIYESPEVAVWLLFISANHQTSMHCHPRKTTGLLLLEGEAELTFLADSKFISAPEKQMIRRGLFHSTRAVSPEGAFLLEIENPNDKSDLIRLSDRYGRVNKGYEDVSHEVLKTDECLWITDPKLFELVNYSIAGTTFSVEATNRLDFVDKKKDSDIVMFLKGGIGKSVEGECFLATIPGDIGRVGIMKKVISEMEFVQDPTVYLTVST